MKLEILSKLEVELKKGVKNEYQAVYLLAQIRKVLESENAKGKYKVLNFYCNWALHSKIDKTEPVGKILKIFITDRGGRYKFIFHEEFEKEFKMFLLDYGLPAMNKSKFNKFRLEMNKVISNTPIDIVIGTRYRIILGNPQLANLNYSITPLIDSGNE